MKITDLNPGDRFHFKGDWQTAPADWIVEDTDDSLVHCRGLTSPYTDKESFFFHTVTVEKL